MTTEEVKVKARNLAVMVRIGKNGLSEGMIDELKAQLKKKKLVKVKMLKSCLGGKLPTIFATEIAAKTNSEIVSHVGNTVVIYKKSG